MIDQPGRRRRGRPTIHQGEDGKKAAAAEASRRYRAKQRAARDLRRVAARTVEQAEQLQASTFIDLSALKYSRPTPTQRRERQMEQKLFFNVTQQSKLTDELKFDEWTEVNMGTQDWDAQRQQYCGTGDVRILLSKAAAAETPLVGFLSFPERAEMIFEGSLSALEALWRKTGNRHSFLRDPRFQFRRA